MRFLRRSETPTSTDAAGTTATAGETATASPQPGQGRGRTHTTEGKGHATPKRRDAQGKRRGPAPAPPRTQREAAKFAKANRPQKSKEERRAEAAERRRRMDAGDDRVLMPRDRGPVRGYVRDIVDSRPHLIGLFLPLAALVIIAALIQSPVIQQYMTLFTFLMLIVMVIEGVLLGRQVMQKVRAKFPDEDVRALPLGWYAFSRATQLRKMRVPKPRVQRGADV
ncbi:DUF3043 domain-containing protein [Pseudonocardia phyllosphaerae]|uniref:DUF3043 domain-containing protein n=1 Tax=Pseudonocardia phyllosphaerae TaxID=3390502 RepID=UPI00397B06EC